METPRKKLTVLVDMDSILADFCGGMIDLHKQETGEVLTQDEVGAWDFVFSNGKDCYYYFSRPGFFRNLKLIDGAREAIKAFKAAGHDVVIVSAATLTHGPGEKFEWLGQHLPMIPRNDVIFCKRKEFVRGDVLIDDYPHNAKAWKEAHPNGRVLTLKYTYNKDSTDFSLRADHWDEIRSYVLDMENE